MKTIYKVYGHNRQFGWEKLDTTPNKDKAFKTATGLTGKEYFSCMIIRNSENGDEIIYKNDFSKECKVEFVDKVETDFEVRAKIFRESLKVIEQEIEQTKVDVRTDKELTDEQKREQLKGLDRLNQIEEIMRKRNEDAWYK